MLARGRSYSPSAYIKDFARWRAVLPRVPLVGPSFADLTWMSSLGRFLSKEPAVRTATLHRYPLHRSTTDQTDPSFPSIPDLLNDLSSAGRRLAGRPVRDDRPPHGLPFRLDEMNSVSGTGVKGVSDTFASALWVLDTLFNLRSVGVDGVNVHTLPDAGYELFTFTHAASGWSAFVHPSTTACCCSPRRSRPAPSCCVSAPRPGRSRSGRPTRPTARRASC